MKMDISTVVVVGRQVVLAYGVLHPPLVGVKRIMATVPHWLFCMFVSAYQFINRDQIHDQIVGIDHSDWHVYWDGGLTR